MSEENGYISIRIRKRAWYAWIFWIAWILWFLFWIDVSVGSWKEMEYRAFYIAFTVFLTNLVIGLFIWLWRHFKIKKV